MPIYFLPTAKLTFQSSLLQSEVQDQLKQHVAVTEKLKSTVSGSSQHFFEGEVRQNDFKIRRILKSGQNSFIPLLNGQFSKLPVGKTFVEVKCRWPKLILILMTVFIVFGLSLTLLIRVHTDSDSNMQTLEKYVDNKELLEDLREEMEFQEPTGGERNWSTLIIALFPYVLGMVMYNIEVQRAEKKLKDILQLK